jgi:hypothetical protein
MVGYWLQAVTNAFQPLLPMFAGSSAAISADAGRQSFSSQSLVIFKSQTGVTAADEITMSLLGSLPLASLCNTCPWQPSEPSASRLPCLQRIAKVGM